MLNPFTIRGRIIDLRRFANANRHRHPFAPAERYELWLKKFDGIRMQAHDPDQVDARAKWTRYQRHRRRGRGARGGRRPEPVAGGCRVQPGDRGGGQLFTHRDAAVSPSRGLRRRDGRLRGAGVGGGGAEGMLLFAAAAPVYLFACAFRRAIRLALDARQVDRTLAMERVCAGIGKKKS